MLTIGNRKYLFPVLFLLFLILAALGIRIWASNRMFLVEGPAIIRVGPDGLVYVVTDATLYVYDQDGLLDDFIPMQRFGIEKARGDIWVFKNGDLLLRRDTDKKLTIRRELETYFRAGSSKEDRDDSGDGILLRCSRTTYACTPFGHGRDAFTKIAAFKVLVDEERNDVYITDTAAHQLLLYDLNGDLKRKSDPFFLYPNGISRGHDGLLYVADTNHHRVAAVSADYDSYGRIERKFSTINTLGPPEKQWPFALGQDKNDRWWVINAGPGMRNGDLVIYDNDGRIFRHVELPDDADPTSIAVLADKVLVTDVSLMRVYSLALNGELQEDFGSLALQIDCSARLREKNHFAFLSSLMLYVILAAAVAALIIAWKAQAESKAAGQLDDKGVKKDLTDDGGRYADTAPCGESIMEGGFVPGARMPASQGWLWISDALRIVRHNSRIYVALFLVAILNWQGILKVPKFGYLLSLLLNPLIIGMMMLLSRMVVDQKRMDVWNMKLRPHIVALLSTGVVYCLSIGTAAFVAQLITGRSIVGAVLLGRIQDMRSAMTPGADTPFLIGLLMLSIGSLVVFAASWFTPPLIVFKQLPFTQAMVESFKAVMRNFRAFNLYGLVLSGFVMLLLLAVLLVPAFIFIPLGLKTFIAPSAAVMAFLLIAAIGPVLTLSVYTSYVRVFEMHSRGQSGKSNEQREP